MQNCVPIFKWVFRGSNFAWIIPNSFHIFCFSKSEYSGLPTLCIIEDFKVAFTVESTLKQVMVNGEPILFIDGGGSQRYAINILLLHRGCTRWNLGTIFFLFAVKPDKPRMASNEGDIPKAMSLGTILLWEWLLLSVPNLPLHHLGWHSTNFWPSLRVLRCDFAELLTHIF